MYKHLFFDLDNTLWDHHSNARACMLELYQRYDLGRYFKNFEVYFSLYKENNEALWLKYGAGEINKRSLNKERFNAPLRTVMENTEVLAAQIQSDFFPLLSTQNALMPGAIELLSYLKEKGYLLYIISNGFTELQYKKLEASGLAPFFLKVFLSEQIKEHKPSKLYFDYVIKSSNARKKESLVIGDTWEADIIGAKNAGIDHVFYNTTNRTALPFVPTFEISSLLQLKAIL